jgi:phosphatidylglycerol---prolipoprotein diacylglyceryl transferase
MLSGFNIGPVTIHFYGIIIMVGVIAATYLAQREANKKEENGNLVWDMLIWLLIAGILGARIWHILTPMPSLEAQGVTTYYYFTHPLDAVAIWKGGLGIPGAVIGGIVALFFFTRQHHLKMVSWLDILAPSLALGQAIGRWGNFFNQELYGSPTTLPWAIYIDPQHRLPGFENIAYYHPTFLYESLWNLGNMFLLLWLARRFQSRLKPGDTFLIYLIVYSLGRFLLEFLRLDSSQLAGMNANQIFMLGVLFFAIIVLVFRHKPSRPIENIESFNGK